MSHLDYYQFQAKARQVHSVQDVERLAHISSQRYHQIVGPWLPTDRNSPIAELACGHGSFLCWLRDGGYKQVNGIDSSPEQIELARQVTGVSVTLADVNTWLRQQPDASWQTLFGIDLIEHLPKDDLMVLLAGARRVLRPGGRLILRYPNGDSPLVGLNLFNDITHVWTYTSNCLTSLSQMHGFTRAEFVDESHAAICDHRWLKVPLCRISQFILGALFRAAAKDKVVSWSPNLWAALEK
jgi:2-polyprenyl-3-methyl-5-hydroxy-6-metoxy-1,4-benzoquinol methylase